MQCDNCGDQDAVIHVTQIKDNQMTTLHLCEVCAAEQGLDAGTSAPSPLTDFLAQMGKSAGGESSSTVENCPSCGLSLNEFRKSGRLGCASCYSHFDQHLRSLLRRLHGGSQHVGKVYVPPDSEDADRAARVMSLRRSLQRAVDAEDFERAAALRDEIRQLEVAGQ